MMLLFIQGQLLEDTRFEYQENVTRFMLQLCDNGSKWSRLIFKLNEKLD